LNCLGREFLECGIVQGVEIAIVDGEFRIGLSVFSYCGRLELFGLVVSFCTPCNVMGVAESVNIDDVGICWGKQQILNSLILVRIS
jgi:hypothetical protein